MAQTANSVFRTTIRFMLTSLLLCQSFLALLHLPELFLSADISARRYLLLATVAQVALVDAPGDITVMTATAIASVDNVEHFYIVVAGFEMDAEIVVAYLACEADAVEPMGKYDGVDTSICRVIIDYHIAIFGV